MDRDELVTAVFDGELTAAEVRDLRRALEQRVARTAVARQRGEPVDAQWTDSAELREQLAVLREEEAIAGFIEQALAASWARQQILDRLAELADGSADPA
ncbi:MAG: hypothetical protein IT204_11920 [Fimbriimonadaceae bacterium]|nr:hypothetical protein [Fimbriimonadaceae bacterium]